MVSLPFSVTDPARHLVVLQGNVDTLYPIINSLIEALPGDWISLSYNALNPSTIAPQKAKSLLGREFQHGIFDATAGFHLEALTILAGTLKKGSWLLLLLPEQLPEQLLYQLPNKHPNQLSKELPNQLSYPLDIDSIRWNESVEPIATPHFMQHLLSTLHKHHIAIYRSDDDDLLLNIKRDTNNYCQQEVIPSSESLRLQPTAAQSALLTTLSTVTERIVIITAKRGRGKSALAGFFTRQASCCICAPNRQSITTLQQFAQPGTPFFAPDHLLNQLRNTDIPAEWTIIDEAAMIPLPILKGLIEQANRILLLTTIEGYEGTGQGFLLKLLPTLTDYRYLTLTTPIRWLADDPLERFMADLLLEDPPPLASFNHSVNDTLQIKPICADLLAKDWHKFSSLYGLLKIAHYRTTPVDLRRLFDAPNIFIAEASIGTNTAGVVVGIKEGGLTSALSQSVWLGTRRPKGNLVAQSLAAHGGEMQAAKLSSLRINRIAVNETARMRGIGRSLVHQQTELAIQLGCDFISVSFAYRAEIYAFWQACGFTLVHVGSHQEASSGCYAAMIIKPLSTAGIELQQRLVYKLARNWYWRQGQLVLRLPIIISEQQSLDSSDWQELSGFAYGHRPYESSYAALCRLMQALPSILRAHHLNNHLNDHFCDHLRASPIGEQKMTIYLRSLMGKDKLNFMSEAHTESGKKGLIKALRVEIRAILTLVGIDAPLLTNHDKSILMNKYSE